MRSCLSNRLLWGWISQRAPSKAGFFTAGERSRQRSWHWRRREPSSMVLLRFPSCSGCCAARRRETSFPTGICFDRSWRKPLPGQMPRRPIPQQPVPPGPKQPGAVQQPKPVWGPEPSAVWERPNWGSSRWLLPLALAWGRMGSSIWPRGKRRSLLRRLGHLPSFRPLRQIQTLWLPRQPKTRWIRHWKHTKRFFLRRTATPIPRIP